MKLSIPILLILATVLVIALTGQNPGKIAKPEISIKVESLLDSAEFYTHKCLDTAVDFALSAREIASKHDYIEGEVKGLAKAAFILTFKGEPVKMQEIYNQAIYIGQNLKDKSALIDAYFKMGVSYRSLHQFDKSYYYYQQGMDLIFADLDNQTDETMASMYEQLGYLLFYELRDSAVSIGYLNKAKNLYQKLGNKEMFYDMFLNIGDAYRLNHDYGKARTYFDSCKALLAEDYDVLTDAKYYKLVGSLYLDHSNMAMGIDYLNKSVQLYESVRDKKQMGDVYTLLAYAYTNLEDKHKCIDYNILARDKRKEVGAITVLTSSMANLSGNYFNIEDYSTALLYADSALLYATQCEHKMYMHKAAQQFYRIYKKIADNNNALHYMELADSLNKLLLEQKNPTFQLIENKVRLQNRELLESSKAEISHTKTQLEYSIYISLLLLFVIVIFIFWIFKLKMSYSEIK